MAFSYKGGNVLLFCRERPLIMAYCRGDLQEKFTPWAQHHIAHCPGCLQSAMRALDTAEKQSPPVKVPAGRTIVDIKPIGESRPLLHLFEHDQHRSGAGQRHRILWLLMAVVLLGLCGLSLGALVALTVDILR